MKRYTGFMEPRVTQMKRYTGKGMKRYTSADETVPVRQMKRYTADRRLLIACISPVLRNNKTPV